MRTRRGPPPWVAGILAGAVFAATLPVAYPSAAVSGSAARLEVNGGGLHVFTIEPELPYASSPRLVEPQPGQPRRHFPTAPRGEREATGRESRRSPSSVSPPFTTAPPRGFPFRASASPAPSPRPAASRGTEERHQRPWTEAPTTSPGHRMR